MDVIRAVTREEAGKLKEAGERQREKADKRNLYLLREGSASLFSPAVIFLYRSHRASHPPEYARR